MEKFKKLYKLAATVTLGFLNEFFKSQILTQNSNKKYSLKSYIYKCWDDRAYFEPLNQYVFKNILKINKKKQLIYLDFTILNNIPHISEDKNPVLYSLNSYFNYQYWLNNYPNMKI